jgi:drug/metabolite transporter (DMT)-like permease
MNISQAGQKIGLARKDEHALSGWALWIGATIGTLLSVAVVLVALSIGAVSLVGAMAGSGLVTLAVFSHFVMREPIGKFDLLGIALIIAGSALIGLFALEQGEPSPRWLVLHGFTVALVAAYLVAWLLARGGDRTGLVLGGFGGALAGASMLYQNAATIVADVGALIYLPLAESLAWGRLSALVNVYLILWFVISNGAFVLLQFAYGRGKAIHVIPAFNVNFIVVPVLGGVIAFAERVHLLQWVGVAIIVAGTVLLTAKPSDTQSDASASTARPSTHDTPS